MGGHAGAKNASLTPMKFNKKSLQGRLWREWLTVILLYNDLLRVQDVIIISNADDIHTFCYC